MSNRRRLDDFQGSEAEYILYLENSLLKLRAPPPTRSLDSANRTNISGKRIQFTPPSSPSDVGGINFIPYDCSGIRPTKRTHHGKPRWQVEMDALLNVVPKTDGWLFKRQSLNLASLEGNLLAIADLLHGSGGVDPEALDVTTLSFERENLPKKMEALLRSAHVYAYLTNYFPAKGRIITEICLFRQLIFVSLCAVMIRFGVSKEHVDSVMRVYFGESKEKYLERLRLGSVWVNRNVSLLSKCGWNHRSSEIFLLCGQSVHTYGRFADSGKQSSIYFIRRLTEPAYTDPVLELPRWMPFSIPCIIKRLVGDSLKLSEICSFLEYDYDDISNIYATHFEENKLIPDVQTNRSPREIELSNFSDSAEHENFVGFENFLSRTHDVFENCSRFDDQFTFPPLFPDIPNLF